MIICKRLEQLQKLSFVEWRILLLSMLLLPVIALGLRLNGFQWTRAWLSNHVPQKNKISISEDEQLRVARGIARMVSVAANHGLYHANCLKKSLAIKWLLERRGIITELKIGVNKEGGDFNAHAWVEFRGNTLIDPKDVGERFSAFASYHKPKDKV